MPDETPPQRVELSRVQQIVALVVEVQEERGYDSMVDTLDKIENCPGGHQNWVECLDRKGMGTGVYRCSDCGLTPELSFALDIELEMAFCGHTVYTARDYELLGCHVDTQSLSETAGIWSCSMDMDDWGE